MSFVSYAQNFEDVLLHRVFGGQETGFYVDVGAYHPIIGSVTKAFYDKGWGGINVEPGSVFADLAAARPRDVNLRMAVFDHAGEIAFFEDEADRGMSRVVMDAAGGDGTAGRAVPRVPCDTLQAIVDAHSNGRPVDFVKIDAEGAETAIVHATDWRRLRPRVLLLEATRPWSSMLANQDWEPALLQQGYVRAYFDGINCFYIPEEEAPALLRHFQVPVNVLDRAERHDNEAARADLHAQQAEVGRLTAERDTLRTALDATSVEATRLTAERDTLRDQQIRLTAERDTLRTALDATSLEATRLTAERDTLRTALDATSVEATRLTAEWDTLRAALDATSVEATRLTTERDTLRDQQIRLTAERDTLRTALDAKFAETAWLAETVKTLEARLAPPLAAPVAPPLRIRERFGRRAAKAAYRLVRPIVRPVAWRLRTFMTSDLVGQIGRLDQRVEVLAAAPTLSKIVVAPEMMQPGVVQIRDDGAAAEMRQLAVEMERTLLTLALERAPAPWRTAPPAQPAPGPETGAGRSASAP